jgi:hypothetical protein
MRSPVAENPGDHGHYPYTILVTDQETTRLEYLKIAPPWLETCHRWREAFLQALTDAGYVPKTLCVRDPRIENVLKPLAQRLQVELRIDEQLPLASEIRDRIVNEVV